MRGECDKIEPGRVDERAFNEMKDGAYFLNVGRGTAVDTRHYVMYWKEEK